MALHMIKRILMLNILELIIVGMKQQPIIMRKVNHYYLVTYMVGTETLKYTYYLMILIPVLDIGYMHFMNVN